MLRHALAFLAAVALAFSPLAVNTARAECDMAGMVAMAMSTASDGEALADPCCDHGKTMSAKDCVKACAVSCASSVATPCEAAPLRLTASYRVEARWSNTSGRTHALIPEDPPPRMIA